MRIEVFNISKKHLWTLDVGFPVPRIGETISFGAPLSKGPYRVQHVHYEAVSGIGESHAEVFVHEETP